MRVTLVVLLLLAFVSSTAIVPGIASDKPSIPARPVHTFSIVARDPDTGELGVAVQSHWFSVGPIVAWAEAGVGAVATQSFVDPSYGKNGLELMRAGKSAKVGAIVLGLFDGLKNALGGFTSRAAELVKVGPIRALQLAAVVFVEVDLVAQAAQLQLRAAKFVVVDLV